MSALSAAVAVVVRPITGHPQHERTYRILVEEVDG